MAIEGAYSGHAGNLMVEAFFWCDKIETECEINDKKKYSRLLGFQWGLMAPVDLQTGQATGRRQHQPIQIRKLQDKSSALIMDAICTHKMLDKAEILISGIHGKEQKKVDKFKVSLEKVRFIECVTQGGADGNAAIIDHVKMAYEKITYEDLQAKKIATDDWAEL